MGVVGWVHEWSIEARKIQLDGRHACALGVKNAVSDNFFASKKKLLKWGESWTPSEFCRICACSLLFAWGIHGKTSLSISAENLFWRCYIVWHLSTTMTQYCLARVFVLYLHVLNFPSKESSTVFLKKDYILLLQWAEHIVLCWQNNGSNLLPPLLFVNCETMKTTKFFPFCNSFVIA